MRKSPDDNGATEAEREVESLLTNVLTYENIQSSKHKILTVSFNKHCMKMFAVKLVGTKRLYIQSSSQHQQNITYIKAVHSLIIK